MTLTLQPRGANVNVVSRDGKQLLFSYATLVGVQLADGRYFKTATFYSKTTSKHLNANGYRDATPLPQAELDKLAE